MGVARRRPVQVVLALVLRDGAAAADHLRVLATLARRLMHDEFRDRLAARAGPGVVVRIHERGFSVPDGEQDMFTQAAIARSVAILVA